MFSNPNSDDWLDARLRDVAAPAGYARRLEQAVWNDDAVDAALRDVVPPASLARKLADIPLETEESLDEILRQVPLPGQFSLRLQRVATRRLSWRRVGELAVAGLIIFGLSLLYAGASAGLLLAVAPTPRVGPHLDSEALVLVGSTGMDEASFEGTGADADPLDARLSPSTFDPVAAVLTPIPPLGLETLSSHGIPAASATPDLARAWVRGDYRAADPFFDAAYARWGPVYGVHRAFDDLPELDKVIGLRPRGIDPPLVPGFDWATYRLFGVFPFASPRFHGLEKSVVPLGVRPTSFETLERFVADGMLPPASSVRTEEVLAAIDYDFPPPQSEPLRLVVAAGPSLFGGERLHLLQVGVQAQQLSETNREPVRLTLALDVSASMNWGGRLAMVRRALVEFLARLRPDDRVSVVAFAEHARVLAEDLAPGDRALLQELLEGFEARGSTSLGEGLRTAFAVAEGSGPPDDAPRTVVLMTDGLTELDVGTAGRIEQHLAESVRQNVLLEVIDLAQERTRSPELASLAKRGGGSVRHAASGDEVGWALAEIVTGRSQAVARDVRLEVTFQPRSVLQYRLFGHEANPAADLMPSHPECDFHSGQSATALYELQFIPKGGDEVAVVELSWRDAENRPRRLVERVRRSQFAATLVDAPLSLQAATVAAETAEILRDSPMALYPASAPWSWVVQVGTHLDSRLSENESFMRFIDVVEQAAAARSYRRNPRR